MTNASSVPPVRQHDTPLDLAGSASPEPRVASWYTQGRSDGLGDRLLMFDNTNAVSLELLRFRSTLAATSGFEVALRERVDRLGRFEHPAFSAIRAVEHLDEGGGLALVSTHVPGRRLSEMFQGPQPRAGLHPAFVTWLIRQLTPALAALQSEGHEFCHGALGADRVVVTAEGHLLIAEHVLGSALQRLRLTSRRLSQEFGVIAPATELGVARLDARTDVVQLGLTALSVLLGRRLTLEEFQDELEPLLNEFSDTARHRSPFLVPPLRRWLERALQFGDYGFRSASDAQEGLKELPEATSPRGFASVRSAIPVALPAGAASTRIVAGPLRTGATNSHTQDPAELHVLDFAPADRLASDAVTGQASLIAPSRGVAGNRGYQIRGWLTLGLALIALVEAGVVGRLLSASSSPLAPMPVPIVIESPQAGDVVMVDGRRAGTTPLTITVGSDTHSIRLYGPESPARGPLLNPTPPIDGPSETDRASGRTIGPPAQAATRLRPGGVRLISPIELYVLENDRVLGSSADGPIVAAAGVHELVLINTALGYRTRQRVNINEGQIVPLTITPPHGRVSINAIPWAHVSIDGRPVGETPLADVSVPAGEHTITFRHPELGERREAVTVRPGAETRVSATLDR